MCRIHRFAVAALLVCVTSTTACGDRPDEVEVEADAAREGAALVTGPLRLSGTVEAVRTRAVTAPRLRGANPAMTITYLIQAGTRVEPGDLLVAFDPQEQERQAFDARAELVDLQGQIAKKRADQGAAEAKDQTELRAATNDVARAKLSMQTNALIAPVEAEKNTLALEQAEAKLEQLQKTYDLKRKAAAADLKILEIRAERSARALDSGNWPGPRSPAASAGWSTPRASPERSAGPCS
jgi:hypothetical protein